MRQINVEIPTVPLWFTVKPQCLFPFDGGDGGCTRGGEKLSLTLYLILYILSLYYIIYYSALERLLAHYTRLLSHSHLFAQNVM